MEYTRLHGNASGESHFENVLIDTIPVEFALPASPLNLATPMRAERGLLCAIPPG